MLELGQRLLTRLLDWGDVADSDPCQWVQYRTGLCRPATGTDDDDFALVKQESAQFRRGSPTVYQLLNIGEDVGSIGHARQPAQRDAVLAAHAVQCGHGRADDPGTAT